MEEAGIPNTEYDCDTRNTAFRCRVWPSGLLVCCTACPTYHHHPSHLPPPTCQSHSDLVIDYDMQDPKVLHLKGGKKYGFDGALYDSVTQKQVFNTCILPVLKNVADGYQSAVLAYGQTGSASASHIAPGPRRCV